MIHRSYTLKKNLTMQRFKEKSPLLSFSFQTALGSERGSNDCFCLMQTFSSGNLRLNYYVLPLNYSYILKCVDLVRFKLNKLRGQLF